MATRRRCTVCLRSRDLKFYGPDARRKDGLSERCVTCAKGKRQASSHGQRIFETYGITADEYAALLAAQGGVCAICKGKRSYNLDVDHCHKLERAGTPVRECVRGLLCRQCNRRILRSARDDVTVLLNAVAYLQQPPARNIIGVRGAP